MSKDDLVSRLQAWAEVVDIPSGKFVNEDIAFAADRITALEAANAALMAERTSLIETKRQQLEAQHRQHIADLAQARGETEVDKQTLADLSAKLKLAEAALEPFAKYAWSLRGWPESQVELGWLGQNEAGEPDEVSLYVATFNAARSALHSIRAD